MTSDEGGSVSLRRRLERLEAARGDRCPECGLSEATNSGIEYVVEWEPLPTEEEISDLRAWYEAFQSSAPALGNRTGAATEEEPEDPTPDESSVCPQCGRQTLCVVDWDDAPTPEEHRRLEARMFAHAREHPEVHCLHFNPQPPASATATEGEE
jgi:hypothetical protein